MPRGEIEMMPGSFFLDRDARSLHSFVAEEAPRLSDLRQYRRRELHGLILLAN
jgi:hypothetical protein